ncbi:hypothetical protein [Paenibacillus pinihumi]|uniref:hypothetical protein n=1 Tax=Paenibacillus pinihumi TaxID=669462 RepID=UPI0003F6D3E4|nr:hypothetical protein [Paenibacillus pinihumi]
MNIKKLATATLLGTALIFGSFSISTVSANAAQVQSIPSIVLKVGQTKNANAIVIMNYDSAISYSSGVIRAVKPGTALVRIYENNRWVDYEIIVSRF